MTSTIKMHPDLKSLIFDEQALQQRIKELWVAITSAYPAGEPIVLICILRGAVVFLADLMRHINLPLEIDFMALSSYGNSTVSSGVVNIQKDISQAIQGRQVLIIEDIIDSGLTLKYLIDYLQNQQPKSIKTCVLLDKIEARKIELQLDFVGFTIPDEFVVGYGLDYAGKYRNLPYIGILKKEVYS